MRLVQDGWFPLMIQGHYYEIAGIRRKKEALLGLPNYVLMSLLKYHGQSQMM